MKEIYRSFEGKLNIGNDAGYIIYDLGEFYQIDFLNVETAKEDKVRIRKQFLSEDEFSNLDIGKIGRIMMDIENGCGDYGQCFYHGKWYGYDIISKIQNEKKTYNWQKFVFK